MGKAGKAVTAVFNQKEWEAFLKYKKTYGLGSNYEAMKHLVKNSPRLFGEPIDEIPPGYSMPEVVAEAMEKEIDKAAAMKPETARKTLSQILGRKNTDRAIDAYSVYAGDQYKKMMDVLADRAEYPPIAMRKILQFWRLCILAVRASGSDPRATREQFWHFHLDHGRFTKSEIDNSRLGRGLEVMNKAEFAPERNGI